MVSGDRPPCVSRPLQETLGIAFLGGEGPLPARCRALTEEARKTAGAAPVIAAADSGLLLAEAAGIRPHWIAGDMDSLPDAVQRLSAYPPQAVLRYPAGKDYTDAELALSLLREQGCVRVWIIGGGGGRTDHLFAVRSLFERPNPPERWLTAAEDIRCAESPAVLTLAAPDGPVSVFPLGDGPWEAESAGLRWPLAGLPWERGFFGVSNEAPAGRFTVTAKQGRFMVITPLDHAG